MRLIKDLGLQIISKNNNRKARYGMYSCPECLRVIRALAGNVAKSKTGRCSRCSNIKHGLSGSRVHNIWLGIKARCENESDTGYKSYGGKGIAVCDEWQEFQSFNEWACVSSYSSNLTIDRINGEIGYSPDNCRWVSMSVQQANKKIGDRNTSGFIGVSKVGRKWKSLITMNGNNIFEYRSYSKSDAARERDAYILNNKLPHKLNFKYFN